MNDGVLKPIRQAVRDKKYQITDHALEEADDDDLTLDDILSVLLNGDLDSIYADDLRGTRYVVRHEIDEDEIEVVCRFRGDGTLLIIITVYRVY